MTTETESGQSPAGRRSAVIEKLVVTMPETGPEARCHSPVATISLVIWLGTVITATSLMTVNSASSGRVGSPPVRWPAASHVVRDVKFPTLIMFVHPHCPCSRASIGELALLMAHCQGRVSAHVVFVKPQEVAMDWVQTDIWRAVAKIPGVTVHCDDSGREARRFGVETSGDTVLYDAHDRLTFHGGITLSRGHSGDNPGRLALQASLLGEPLQLDKTPVFGCSLFNSELQQSPTCERGSN